MSPVASGYWVRSEGERSGGAGVDALDKQPLPPAVRADPVRAGHSGNQQEHRDGTTRERNNLKSRQIEFLFNTPTCVYCIVVLAVLKKTKFTSALHLDSQHILTICLPHSLWLALHFALKTFRRQKYT